MGNFIFVASVGALLVLAGLAAFRSARRGLRDDLASRDWPHVVGQIVKAGNIPSYGVSVRSYYVNYEYEVAGVKHKGSEVLGIGNEEADPLVRNCLLATLIAICTVPNGINVRRISRPNRQVWP